MIKEFQLFQEIIFKIIESLKEEIMTVIFFQNLQQHGVGPLGKIDGKIVLTLK